MSLRLNGTEVEVGGDCTLTVEDGLLIIKHEPTGARRLYGFTGVLTVDRFGFSVDGFVFGPVI